MADLATAAGTGRAPGPGRHARPEPDSSLEMPFSRADLAAIADSARGLVNTYESGILACLEDWRAWGLSAAAVLREVSR